MREYDFIPEPPENKMDDTTITNLLNKIASNFDDRTIELNGKSYFIKEICDEVITKIKSLECELDNYCAECGFNKWE